MKNDESGQYVPEKESRSYGALPKFGRRITAKPAEEDTVVLNYEERRRGPPTLFDKSFGRR